MLSVHRKPNLTFHVIISFIATLAKPAAPDLPAPAFRCKPLRLHAIKARSDGGTDFS